MGLRCPTVTQQFGRTTRAVVWLVLAPAAAQMDSHGFIVTDAALAQQPTTTAPFDGMAAQIVKHLNKAGDMNTLLSSVLYDSIIVMFGIVTFCVLRLTFPLVYQGNAEKAAAEADQAELATEPWPPRPGRGFFDWVRAAMCVSIDDVQTHCGLDTAMLLEFCSLCAKISATIGLPMCLVMCPINIHLGSKDPTEVDSLSRMEFHNVVQGSWLCWVYAAIVAITVWRAQQMVMESQASFLTRRYTWLKCLKEPRCSTVMVENIPEDLQSDSALRNFFGRMFKHQAVLAVHVVRWTDVLQSLNENLKRAEEARAEAEKAESKPEVLERLEEEVDRARKEVHRERFRLQRAEENTCSSTAFVTFSKRSKKEIAERLQYFPESDSCIASIPPEASDIRWDDLRRSPAVKAAEERVGLLCVIGTYLAFAPFCLGVTSVTNLDHLQSISPLVKKIVVLFPKTATFIEGTLASLALSLFLSFLPTVMMLIFDNFYTLKANRWAQEKLQIWYFWFQIVFILLITAIGNSLFSTLEDILYSPMRTFTLLASSLPKATHFYLNYVLWQSATHALNFTRYLNLIKFLMLRMVYGSRQAKELSEPEDQDYYGIGSRSARWAVTMVIGLVFSSISPLINVIVCVHFLICRLVYGYLLVYAEVPKVDLGGVFFIRKLKHVQHGLFIYVGLMVGCLLQRSGNNGPALLAAASFAWLVRKRWQFENLQWETLPFSEIIADEEIFRRPCGEKENRDADQAYVEPELRVKDTEVETEVDLSSRK